MDDLICKFKVKLLYYIIIIVGDAGMGNSSIYLLKTIYLESLDDIKYYTFKIKGKSQLLRALYNKSRTETLV